MNINSQIRKYFVDALSPNFPVFDSRQGTNNVNQCYLVTSQGKDLIEGTKCGYNYECTIEIEILNRTDVTANASSKRILEQMENFVENAYNSFNLTNFTTTTKNYREDTFDSEISQDNIDRKVILMNFKINK